MERIGSNIEPQMQEMHTQKSSNKRKRESPGINGRTLRPPPSPENAHQEIASSAEQLHANYFAQRNHTLDNIQDEVAHHVANANASANANANGSSSTAAAALAASMPQLTVPQPTELSFQNANPGNDQNPQMDSSFDMGPDSHQQNPEGAPYDMNLYPGVNGDQGQNMGGSAGKPAVGTDEWHKVRKDNHKEVERRRRETINEGINELAKIVPGCDKNKGAILQRGVQYITQLKDNETRNIEKWTLEKMLTDQAIAELTSSVDKLREELGKQQREAERWKARCEAAGVDTKVEEASTENGRGR